MKSNSVLRNLKPETRLDERVKMIKNQIPEPLRRLMNQHRKLNKQTQTRTRNYRTIDSKQRLFW